MTFTLRNAIALETLAGGAAAALYASTLMWAPNATALQAIERGYTDEVARLESEIRTLSEVVDPLEKRLLRQEEIPRFLEVVSRTALDCGFELDLVVPGGVVRGSGPPNATIDVAVRQPYAGLLCYLRSLAALPRLFCVRSLTVSSREEQPPGAPPRRLDADLSLTLHLAEEAQ